jgi:hypothetical protein
MRWPPACELVKWSKLVTELLRFSPCELLLLEAGDKRTAWEARGRGTSVIGSRQQKTGEDTAG